MKAEEKESFVASIIPRFVFLVCVLLAVASMVDLEAIVTWTAQHKSEFMTSEIIAAMVGAAIALLGARTTRRSEEKRWYADTFLKAKIESLQVLYATLNHCFFKVSNGLDYPPSTYDQFNIDVLRAVSGFNRADQIATVYLDHESEQVVRRMGAQIGLASHAIRERLDAQLAGQTNFSTWPQFDRKDLNKTFDEMRSCFRELLNPSLLRQFENLE